MLAILLTISLKTMNTPEVGKSNLITKLPQIESIHVTS